MHDYIHPVIQEILITETQNILIFVIHLRVFPLIEVLILANKQLKIVPTFITLNTLTATPQMTCMPVGRRVPTCLTSVLACVSYTAHIAI